MLPGDLTEWLREHLSYAHVALFLGAGFSTEAQNRLSQPLPDSRRLAELLWEYLGHPPPFDGTDLPTLYQAAFNHRKGHAALQEFLHTYLLPTHVPDWYSSVASFLWSYVFTTNIDTVLEIAWNRHPGRPTLRVMYAPQDDYRERDPFLGSVTFVKLHGCITKGPTRVTFSPMQYASRAVVSDPWYDHFIRTYATIPTIFVGTNLNEPLFWQYLQVRMSRGHGTETRPRSLLVAPSISPARLEALRDLHVHPVEATARDFFTWLSATMTEVKDASIIRKNVALRLGVEELLPRTEALPDKRARLEQFYLGLRPVTTAPPRTGHRSYFLLGSEPTWADISSDLDAEREATSTLLGLVKERLTDTSLGEAILLLGTAGSGKSTILKRLAFNLVNDGIPVYFCDGDELPSRDSIRAFVEASDRRAVFMLDNIHRYSGAVAEWSSAVRGSKFQPLMVGAARPNQYERRLPDFARLQKVHEAELQALTDDEVHRILERLEAHNLLGGLRQLNPKQRFEVFHRVAWKQLLVAMREATQGRAFDDIIRDEFQTIPSEEGKRLFLVAAIPTALQFSIRRTELIAASRVEPAHALRILAEELRGLVVSVGTEGERLIVRHPLIAEQVLRGVANRLILRDAYIDYLRVLANTIDKSKGVRDRAFRMYSSLSNHRHIYERFDASIEYARAVYDGVEPFSSSDGHFWLQYGSLELLYGDLGLAENFLLQAEAFLEHDDLVGTALGHLYLKRGIRAPSLEEATRLREQGENILNPLIAKRGGYDSVVYHVRASQLLGWLRSWSAFLTRERLRQELEELHAFVQRAMERHPRNPELRQLEKDVRKDLLMTAVQGTQA